MREIAKTKTVHISIESASEGQTLEGDFTLKRLSYNGMLALQKRTVQKLGGFYCVRDGDGDPVGIGASPESESFAEMMAHLELSVIKHPPWWNMDDLADLDVLKAVYQEVIAFEDTFRPGGRDGVRPGASGGVAGRSTAVVPASAAGSGSVSTTAGSGGRDPQVVVAGNAVALDL